MLIVCDLALTTNLFSGEQIVGIIFIFLGIQQNLDYGVGPQRGPMGPSWGPFHIKKKSSKT